MRLLAMSMALALYSSPFTDCGDAWSRKEAQDAARQQPPPTTYCATDPPNGCGATCFEPDTAQAMGLPPDTASFTDFCGDLSAGDLTVQFKDDVQTIYSCDTKAMGGAYIVFPTYFSIMPVVVGDGSICTPPPPPPPTLMIKDLLGQ